MGIDSTLTYFLATTARRFDFAGTLCTLGVQDIRSTPEQLEEVLAAAGLPPASDQHVDLYGRLGFARVESIDISDFEGCTHLVDLNVPGVPHHLRARYDVVYNGGTLEHVFDLRTALRNVFELLKTGGIAIHVFPSNGWVDHGFYQFSPTLLTDYYSANGFEVLEATLLEPGVDAGEYVAHTYVPGSPLPVDPATGTGRWLSYVTVRKGPTSTWDIVPRQSYYAAMHSDAVRFAVPVPYRPPFRIESGIPVRVDVQHHALPPPRRGNGFEWVAPVPHLRLLADGMDGAGSPLMLFEDGEPIGPAHTLHEDIRTLGGGRYSHWNDALHFAPSRNDDARDHVYTYALHDLHAEGVAVSLRGDRRLDGKGPGLPRVSRALLFSPR